MTEHIQNTVLSGSAFSEGNRTPCQLFQQRKFNTGNNLNRLWRIEEAEQLPFVGLLEQRGKVRVIRT